MCTRQRDRRMHGINQWYHDYVMIGKRKNIIYVKSDITFFYLEKLRIICFYKSVFEIQSVDM